MSHATVLVAVECEGAGEVEDAVCEQMRPFDENLGEDAGWFRDGSRWDWWVIGGRYPGRLLGRDCARRNALTEAALECHARERANSGWNEWLAEKEHWKPLWDMPADMTRERWIEQHVRRKLSFCAFLRGQRWYENTRMGFFGMPAKSECEAAGRGEGKCVVGDLRKPPCIVGFNEDEEQWQDRYWTRFVAPLPPETWLAVVDYHV